MVYEFVGDSFQIRKIRELISLVSNTPMNVLIMGETGTGKEIVARLLHYSSQRRNKRFIKINCPSLPVALLESELFGYEKGAFTGAVKSKPGKFEIASDGVIFLDEIGDMPLVLQSKFLQVLQSGEFTRLGGTNEVKVGAWVISATNHDLEDDINKGLFREDLYYRINIIKIQIPPLRERRDDIPSLTEHLIGKFQSEFQISILPVLDSELKELFQTYDWPGNVRELSSFVIRLVIGEEPDILKAELIESMQTGDSGEAHERMSTDDLSHGADAFACQHRDVPPWSLKDIRKQTSRYIEKEIIQYALEMTGKNKKRAAEMLQISYKALFYKMDDYGIRR